MALATSAYLWWGLVPIYWKQITWVPPAEAQIPRILWTLILLLFVARASGRRAETWTRDRGAWGWSIASGLLLAGNWCLFVYAVQTDRVLAASLGYYINPLVSVLLGLIVLGERTNRAQAIAITVAALGVGALTLRAGELPWISLVLAVTFALYGLIHKLHPRPPVAGLTREMLVLTPLALLATGVLAWQGDTVLLGSSPGLHLYLALSSVVTAVPLLLFHAATRRLPLVAIGMLQYLAPTINLALATLLYDEPFSLGHAVGFGLVWFGLALFAFDTLRRARRFRDPIPDEIAVSRN